MKNLNLATTTTITSTYAGEFAQNYISAMLLASSTLGNNTISTHPNIKYKQVVKKLVTSDILAGATCDFSPVGSVVLTERIIEPIELQVNLELCKLDFKSDWDAISMGWSAFDQLPKNFTDFLIGNISATIGASIENMIWAGVGGANAFTGFTHLLAADATVVDVVAAVSGVTAANVIEELGKVVSALSNLNIYSSGEKPVIYVPQNIYFAYQVALGAIGGAGYKNEGPNQSFNDLYYAGIKLVPTPGMPSNKMIGAQPSNLWFGTGLLSDTNKVQVLDMAELDGSENVRFIARFTGSVQFGIGSEIVYYA